MTTAAPNYHQIKVVMTDGTEFVTYSTYGSEGMDFMAQVQNYMMSQQYESLLKKANFKAS